MNATLPADERFRDGWTIMGDGLAEYAHSVFAARLLVDRARHSMVRDQERTNPAVSIQSWFQSGPSLPLLVPAHHGLSNPAEDPVVASALGQHESRQPERNMSNETDLPFQRRVVDWMMETFSMEVCRDTTERNHRFLEESLELVQAMGCTQAEAHMLVDYVYGRPTGEPEQEVGGVMVTLAALCSAADFSMPDLGNRELDRCWLNIERIRAKQAGKPRNSPLPGSTP